MHIAVSCRITECLYLNAMPLNAGDSVSGSGPDDKRPAVHFPVVPTTVSFAGSPAPPSVGGATKRNPLRRFCRIPEEKPNTLCAPFARYLVGDRDARGCSLGTGTAPFLRAASRLSSVAESPEASPSLADNEDDASGTSSALTVASAGTSYDGTLSEEEIAPSACESSVEMFNTPRSVDECSSSRSGRSTQPSRAGVDHLDIGSGKSIPSNIKMNRFPPISLLTFDAARRPSVTLDRNINCLRDAQTNSDVQSVLPTACKQHICVNRMCFISPESSTRSNITSTTTPSDAAVVRASSSFFAAVSGSETHSPVDSELGELTTASDDGDGNDDDDDVYYSNGFADWLLPVIPARGAASRDSGRTLADSLASHGRSHDDAAARPPYSGDSACTGAGRRPLAAASFLPNIRAEPASHPHRLHPARKPCALRYPTANLPPLVAPTKPQLFTRRRPHPTCGQPGHVDESDFIAVTVCRLHSATTPSQQRNSTTLPNKFHRDRYRRL